MIQIKRIYEDYRETDGARVLVDRLWPRGVSKEKAHLDLWLKDIAPSNELRTWFGHDPKKWNDFHTKYLSELKNKTELINQVKQLEKKHKTVTLLYGAKDTKHNQAVIITELLT
ncbi:MAG TPA: DUF488 domain-containing protein [Candidatus Acidoferrales bacterium]|nr:DUF488 domain-containing protein [Candidatus Acidoferrales bacterium]